MINRPTINDGYEKSNLVDNLRFSRRSLLTWTTPIVVAIALPVHAQTSVCGSAPIMTAATPSKCSGSPPLGQAVLTITSDGADSVNDKIEISAINVIGAASSDSFTIPGLPVDIVALVGVDIQWSGNASDAVTCLPTSSITFEVIYRCGEANSDSTIVFDMTAVLADAI